jgi:superfamily II DNA/RNA helicase
MRLLSETPPPGIMYYKYKPKTDEGKEEQEEKNVKNSRHPIIETDDRSKIKIRFSDLPLSRCTQNGLFKSKFIKMTEV